MSKRSEGFTVIEVVLFIAISGLLLLMAFMGTGTMASKQRFTDSTDSLQAYFQSQYSQVVNGVNPQGMSGECGATSVRAGMNDTCLLIGKLITVNKGKLDSHYVISTNMYNLSPLNPSTNLPWTDQEKLKSLNLKVVESGSESEDMRWGAETYETGMTRSTKVDTPPNRDKVNSIAFLRVPDGSRIIKLYYRNSNPGVVTGDELTAKLRNAVNTTLTAFDPPSTASEPSLVVCLQNDGDFNIGSHIRSAIQFDSGGGGGSITTNYNPGVLCP